LLIKIKHKKFDADNETERTIEPYLLKEYLDRWYIIGFDKSVNEIRSFGLDRIIDVEILEKKFKKRKTQEVKQWFENTIGIVYTKPEIVRLLIKKDLSNYFKSNPWHKNYTIIEETDEELVVELLLSLNYELEQKILMHNKNVIVLAPQVLKDRILFLLQESMNQYQ
jgi:predicted DNA-binding transcriptional regulator YafY